MNLEFGFWYMESSGDGIPPDGFHGVENSCDGPAHARVQTQFPGSDWIHNVIQSTQIHIQQLK